MKIWRWLASILLSLTIAFFIIASFLYTPEEPVQTQPAEPVVTKEETDTPPVTEPEEEDEAIDSPEEKTEDPEEETFGEGLKEVFTTVIEGARDLFVSEDIHITALGDSLTEGIGDVTGNGGYVGILKDTLNNSNDTGTVVIDNFGDNGDTTTQLLGRLDEKEVAQSVEDADLILITIGANDVMEVVQKNFMNLNYRDFVAAQKDYEKHLEQIFKKVNALNPEAPIYLIGLYNPFERYFNNIPELGQITSDWNRVSKEVISNFEDTTFIPIKDLFDNPEEELLWEKDHFHPNIRGYKQMAERVLEYIKEDIE